MIGPLAVAGSTEAGSITIGPTIANPMKTSSTVSPIIPCLLRRNVRQWVARVARRRAQISDRADRSSTGPSVAISGLPDPRVEVAVRDVGHQVAHQHRHAGQQEHGLDHRVVELC